MTIACATGPTPRTQPAVAARVHGGSIAYDEIRLSPDALRLAFELAEGRAVRPDDAPRLENLRVEQECMRLRSRIEKAIRRAVFADFEPPEPTPEALAAKAAWFDARTDVPEAERRLKARARLLLGAVERVHVDGADPDDVRREVLGDEFTGREWRIHLEDYRDPARRALLRETSEAVHPLEGGPEAWARELLREEAFDSFIDRRILASDPSYGSVLAAGDRSATEARRALWWQERYRSADVEILDERCARLRRHFGRAAES